MNFLLQNFFQDNNNNDHDIANKEITKLVNNMVIWKNLKQ